MNKEKEFDNKPPTDKQLWKFKQLNLNVPEGLTRYEASMVIKEKSKGEELNDEFPDY